MGKGQVASLAVRCTSNGCILEVVRDDRNVLGRDSVGKLSPLLLDTASAAKCEHFLQRVSARHGAFKWELHARSSRGPLAMWFAGVRKRADELVIAASTTLVSVLDVLDEALRHDHGEPIASRPEQVQEFEPLDELTRVNNDLVNLQRELAKRNAELAALTKQRDELLAAAAHDLRNPIMIVQGYCDLLEGASDPLTPSQRSFVDQLQRAAELMRHVLDDTLIYTKSLLHKEGSGHQRGDVDLLAVVRSTVEVYAPLAEHKDIRVKVHVATEIPSVRVDPTNMQQIVSNLLSNALKYSYPGGQVEVSVEQEGSWAILSVTDHGVGIADAELALLFKPFQTTSSRPTAGEPSTGMGLAIVRKLVEAHGGDVRVESRVQEGTTFTVRLPVAPAPDMAAAAEQDEPTPSDNGLLSGTRGGASIHARRGGA